MSEKSLTAQGNVKADAGVFTWDLSTDTVYADAALAALFGFGTHEAERGQPIVSFMQRISAIDKPRIAQAIHEAIVTGKAYQQDYMIERPDGTRASVSAFGRCFRDSDGTPSHYAGIVCPQSICEISHDPLLGHCLQAYDLASKTGNADLVAALAVALRLYTPTRRPTIN